MLLHQEEARSLPAPVVLTRLCQSQAGAIPRGNLQPHTTFGSSEKHSGLVACFSMQNKIKKKKIVSKLEGLQEKEIKMIKGLEGLTYEERLKELIMYSSDKG